MTFDCTVCGAICEMATDGLVYCPNCDVPPEGVHLVMHGCTPSVQHPGLCAECGEPLEYTNVDPRPGKGSGGGETMETVVVTIEGGNVQDVQHPPTVVVEILDFDTGGADEADLCTCPMADAPHWHKSYGGTS
jgi:hypothetical protein